MQRVDLVAYLDEFLAVRGTADYAENGLQVEGAAEVTRLAFAVDACQETITAAIEGAAQMLIVHHGLFWGKPMLIVGPHRRRVKALLDADCSLYAVHLPLDRHPQVGNNAVLARLLGLQVVGPLGEAFGAPIGLVAEAEKGLTRQELAQRLAAALGRPPLLMAGGPSIVRRIGIITGGAARDGAAAAQLGCDAFITGETSHSHYHDAAELGINMYYAGHYATETVGVKALQAHLAERLGLPGFFIDRPTGL